ncbi:hypothetical protein [Chamaesiphon sp. OTE_75_metabat_556]|nr:hypothetical protein [Chamaesiphon sp. OTE_75_metabat_556]
MARNMGRQGEMIGRSILNPHLLWQERGGCQQEIETDNFSRSGLGSD